MATKRQKKKAVNTAKKVAKKNPTLAIVFLVILLLIGGAFAALYFTGTLDKWLHPEKAAPTQTTEPSGSIGTGENGGANGNVTPSQGSSSTQPIEVNGDVQIYSIEMRDKYGDSIFIKYGDYDILIDAGDDGDGEFVRDFVDSHISSDKNLDLLIVTHCHSDHMGGLTKMSSKDNEPKALDNVSTISNIIDFGHIRSTNPMYKTYKALRESYIAKGTKYYSAYEAVKHVDGLESIINFNDLSVEIIDTFNYASNTTDLLDVKYNEYSVATLITYKNTKLFCAGDLEDVGEKTLVEHANETSLKNVTKDNTVIYKACHHGTDVGSANDVKKGATSTNGGNRMALMQLLNPDYCFVSSAITQSDHPYPRAVATMLYFTDKLYFNGTNGTLCFSLDGTNISVTGAGATTNYKLDGFEIDYEAEKNLIYTETVWYKNHIFAGAKSWYKGDIANPTDKDLTEWYLGELRKAYGA